MAYLRFSQTFQHVHEEFLLAKYLESDMKRETIFRCLKEYLDEHDINHENIPAVATNAIAGSTYWQWLVHFFFAILPKQNVPNVITIHCILH